MRNGGIFKQTQAIFRVMGVGRGLINYDRNCELLAFEL